MGVEEEERLVGDQGRGGANKVVISTVIAWLRGPAATTWLAADDTMRR